MAGGRHRIAAVLVLAALVVSGLTTATTAAADPVKPHLGHLQSTDASTSGLRPTARTEQVGSLTLREVLSIVRQNPWRGVAYDADGVKAAVSVNGPNLTTLAFGATFGPPFYREMTAAMRSGLRGDHAPLLRLVAESLGGGTDAGDPVDYSERLDAAVACHDYPQLYDMTAPPSVRAKQYVHALHRRTASHPYTYGPFTIHEYAESDWQELDWCTRWPVAPTSNPVNVRLTFPAP